MAGEKILIVEDEKPLVKVLKYNLEKEGYRVAAAFDGEAGLLMWRQERPDLIILDLMLPKVDGFDFCKTLRRDCQTPILMLTARKEEVDRVLGLELGADDYVTKPFSVREVLARIKAILKRASGKSSPGIVRAGALEADLERYETRVNGKPVSLSPREFMFLRCLFEADGKALSRDQLLEKVWGCDKSMDIDTRTIDQHVARMREKLGPESKRIVTVKGVGYRIKLD
ncbi:MAG: response regulator transcription factor [Elusimicrobiota bacterium]|jgi:DNA-binding response OmpR family regulator